MEPTPFHEAKTEQVRDTAIMDLGRQASRRPTAREERITEEQRPLFKETARKPATGIMAVDELQPSLHCKEVEDATTGIQNSCLTTGLKCYRWGLGSGSHPHEIDRLAELGRSEPEIFLHLLLLMVIS